MGNNIQFTHDHRNISMRPIYAKTLTNFEGRIFEIREEDPFSAEYHFHNECQLTLTSNSTGQKYIADQFENCEADELILIGPGLPHRWYSKKTDHAKTPFLSLFFDPEAISSLSESLFDSTELHEFFIRSRQGMSFYGPTKHKLKKLLRKMLCASDIQKTAYLFESLTILVVTEEYRLLSNIPYLIRPAKNEGETIDSVYKYVFENFEKDISLDEAAHLANLTKPAFCRFFKARTQKTFSRFVNEIRVNEACRLLRLNENQIAHIAYACGFNSLPNFNKFFKSIKGITPSDYKTKLFT